MGQHRLIVDPKVIEQDQQSVKKYALEHQLRYQLFFQMSHITRDRGSLAHDDRLDVLAMAVKYWTDQVAQDADDQSNKRRQQELDKELARFKNGRLSDGFYGLLTGFADAVNSAKPRWI